MDYPNRESSPPAQHAAAVEVAGPAVAEVDPRFPGSGNIPSWQDLERPQDNDPVTAEHYVGEPLTSPTTLPIPFENRVNNINMVTYPSLDEQQPSVGAEQGSGVNDASESADHTQGSDKSVMPDPQREQPALYNNGSNRPSGGRHRRSRSRSGVRPTGPTDVAGLRRGPEVPLSDTARAAVGTHVVNTYLGGGF